MREAAMQLKRPRRRLLGLANAGGDGVGGWRGGGEAGRRREEAPPRERKRSQESAACAGPEWSMHAQRRQVRNHRSSSSARDAQRSIATPRFSARGSSGSAAAAAAEALGRRPMATSTTD